MKDFRLKYRNLQKEIGDYLKQKLLESNHYSEHIPSYKCLKLINHRDFKEIIFIGDKLVYIDDDGYHYSIFSTIGLDSIIELIQNESDSYIQY